MIGNKRNFPSALVVPNFDEPREVGAGARGSPGRRREELMAGPEVSELYERTVQRPHQGPRAVREIKKIALLPKEFTMEAGELTPTLKVKRRVVEQKYKDLDRPTATTGEAA